MNKIRFIGDIHAQYHQYLNAIQGSDKSVQVGDFGIGFVDNPILDYDVTSHRFIRGNHDYPEGCKNEPNWIPDGTYEDDVFYIGGAGSIDRAYRTQNLDWWEDEQLTHQELSEMIDKFQRCKPKVVVSHEVPDELLWHFSVPIFPESSRTRQALECMRFIHKPKLWISGHWHFSFDKVISGTRFKILNINETFDIDLDEI